MFWIVWFLLGSHKLIYQCPTPTILQLRQLYMKPFDSTVILRLFAILATTRNFASIFWSVLHFKWMNVHHHLLTNMTQGTTLSLMNCESSSLLYIMGICIYHVRLLAEELRKVFIALWEESNCIYSPDSLLSVILKMIPQFR